MTVVLAAALLAACGGREEKAADVPLAGRDCRRASGDSAQAVCIALNTVERVGSLRARVHEFVRHGDTLCVHTFPDRADGVDEEGRVEVVRGQVVSAEVTDSTGCGRG